jgi:hypothetical protein
VSAARARTRVDLSERHMGGATGVITRRATTSDDDAGPAGRHLPVTRAKRHGDLSERHVGDSRRSVLIMAS